MVELILALLATQDRLPVPSAEAQKGAETIIREIFKDEYAKRDQGDRLKLARKLREQALETAGDAPAQFVLLRESKDLASQAGDFSAALQAISELARRFAVDGPGLKAAALAQASAQAKTTEQVKRAAEAYLELVEEGIRDGQLDVAEKAAAAASGLARKAKELPLLTRIEARAKEVAELKGAHDKARKALEVLAVKPDDPAANLALGRYLCWTQGQWDKGLKHLSQGADQALKAIAAKDLKNPTDPAEQAALGDEWWALIESEGPRSKVRAAFWYAKALPSMSGLTRVKVERRLSEAGPMAQAGVIDLVSLLEPEKDAVLGRWQVSDGTLISPLDRWARIQIPYVPPDEYDLKIVVERKEGLYSFEIGLAYRGNQFHIGFDGWQNGDITGLNLVNGRDGSQNETTYRGKLILKDVPTTVLCSVRATGVAVRVGDKLIFDWKGDPSSLGASSWWNIPRRDTLFIGAWESRFRIQRLSLIATSGEGKRIR